MTSVRTSISSLAIVFSLLCGAGAANAQLVGVSPQALAFVYQIGGPNPPAQSLFLSNALPTQFSVQISGAPWLTVSPTTGLTPSTLVASVIAPGAATPGTLNGTILITPVASTDSTATIVAVSLQVLPAAQGNLQVFPNAISVDWGVGSPYPQSSPFSITSTGSAAAFTLSTSASWLSVSASSYITPATAYVNIVPFSGMGPGVYSGFVTVSPSYGGLPQQVSVTLRVYSPGNLTASPNFLSFNYQPGGYPPQSQVVSIVSSTGGSVPYTVSTSTSSGANWITSNVSAGTTPSSFVVSAIPGGLGVGTYYGTVTINTTTAGVSATQIPVTLTVFSSTQLLVDPSSLYFTYQSGGAVPATQYLSVQSTGAPVSFNVAVQGPSWVSASVRGATTPSGFGVTANPPTATPAGTYTASVTVTPSSGGGSPVTVPVTISVTSANYLTVGRTSITINYSVGGTNPAPEIVPVTSSGGPLRFDATAASAGFSSWLSVSQSSAYTPANLTVSFNPAGLTAGTYTGAVIVNSDGASNGQQSIAVTLNVMSSATFTASPFGLVFAYQLNGVAPAPQLLVVSGGSAATGFTTSAVTTSGGNWLLVAGQGTTPATIGAAVNATGLGTGTYTGRILIKSNDGSVPVLEVPVIFNVSTAPVFIPTANQVAFQYETAGAAPASQTVTINTNTNESIVFYTTLVTADGGSWLSVTPSVAATPSAVTISVNPQGLAPGLYYGLVALTNPGDTTPASFVPVTLQISSGPILTVAAQSIWLSAIAGVGGIATQTISVGNVGPPTAFNVSTSGGSWLSANPTSALTGATINVVGSANNLTPGFYMGLVTIQIPGVTGSQQLVPVILTVTSGF